MTVATLAGCAAVLDPQGTQDTLGGYVNQGASDRALAALSRGDNAAAERHALTALKYSSKDPVALMVAGLAYQGMARYELARQYYEVIITNQIPGTIMMPGDGGVAMPRSIVDVARANVGVIDKITGRSVPRSIQESGRLPGASTVGAPPFLYGDSLAGPSRPMVNASQMEPVGYAPAGRVSDAETNVAGRFRILKRLLEEGLITPEEFNRRRTANAGALLPFTSPSGSVGLDRPIPGDEAVVARLRDLGITLETRAITPAQHAAERGTILDALLPAQPRKLDNPPMPPRDMIEAGQAVGRVERMRGVGLVSDAEAKKEKDAIERSLDGQLAGLRVNGTATGLRAGAPGSAGPMAAPTAKATGWGVALTSVKSEEAARKAWEGIKAKFPEQLGGMDAQFKHVGARYKVIAGPVASKDAAKKLCKTLKLHRQACDAASL
ncbi:MAG: SPOR domain-containing protein [Rhodospirillaceae bacterium]|nr:SPOR domain-containing protein [Rhodospirillales bacterium]